MSKINENPLVRGARGNFGKHFIYKKRGNDTHIVRMPSIKKNAAVTDQQGQLRKSFSAASRYARAVINNPALKAEYKKKAGPAETSFNVALRDYLKPPVVEKIDTENYDGTVGSTIVVSAYDDFRVAEMEVSIFTAAGALVEKGNAVLNPMDYNQWTYTATRDNTPPAAITIRAVAKDLPGNKVTLEVCL